MILSERFRWVFGLFLHHFHDLMSTAVDEWILTVHGWVLLRCCCSVLLLFFTTVGKTLRGQEDFKQLFPLEFQRKSRVLRIEKERLSLKKLPHSKHLYKFQSISFFFYILDTTVVGRAIWYTLICCCHKENITRSIRGWRLWYHILLGKKKITSLLVSGL